MKWKIKLCYDNELVYMTIAYISRSSNIACNFHIKIKKIKD